MICSLFVSSTAPIMFILQMHSLMTAGLDVFTALRCMCLNSHIQVKLNTNHCSARGILLFQNDVTLLVQIDLEVREYIRINKSHRLGIMNIAFPGPVDGVFQQGGRVVMSLEKTNNKIIHRGQLLRFDGLQYPYNLPVVLCNETGERTGVCACLCSNFKRE